MTDLRALTDAFAELERRADAASAGTPYELPVRAQPRRPLGQGSRLMPVAATVAVVAGLAVGAALLAPGGDPGTISAGAPPTTGSDPTSAAAPAFTVPRTPDELAARFRVVLGDTATFTVTDTGAVTEAAIVGTLTASGVTGGFDLGIYPADPNATDVQRCDVLDPAHCTQRSLDDGSSLIIGQMPLEGSPNGITYSLVLIRPDGIELTMHVSNQRSAKGGSEELAPHPPLTIDQMIAIATSDRW
jgi:hypothetical protein